MFLTPPIAPPLKHVCQFEEARRRDAESRSRRVQQEREEAELATRLAREERESREREEQEKKDRRERVPPDKGSTRVKFVMPGGESFTYSFR